MDPRLVAIDGPLKGRVFSLSDAETTIGSDEINTICPVDISASPRHCIIHNAGDHFMIEDLNSKTGTFINGIPAKQRNLQSGDKVEIGESLFLFLLDDGNTDTIRAVSERLVAAPTARLKLEELLYLYPEKLLSSQPFSPRMAKGLQGIFNITRALGLVRTMDELHQALMQHLFAFLPAQYGAFLFITNGEITSTVPYRPGVTSTKPVEYCTSIVEMTLKERTAILSNEIEEDPNLPPFYSTLAVPLVRLEEVIAILYIETEDPQNCFDEDHLQLISAVGNVTLMAIANIQQTERLLQENQWLQRDLELQHSLVGESEPMRAVLRLIERVAPTDSTVLILGESGTGKELAARALHQNSRRADHCFVAINCASLSENLLESELFGHERGAFTGAVAQKKGKMEVADGGTLFLDEVTEVSPAIQARLLRFLQEREFERVGGTKRIRVSIRLIAATNRNLEEEMKAGRFREDLFYRLNVIRITMPPLRDRGNDILLLATYFAAKSAANVNRRHVGISEEARKYLLCHRWPGNVRELENAIERAVVLGAADTILPEDLPESIVESQGEWQGDHDGAGYHQAVREAKRQVLLKAIEKAGGNLSEAARNLGIHPNNLHRLLRDLDLRSALKQPQRS